MLKVFSMMPLKFLKEHGNFGALLIENLIIWLK